MSRILLCPLCRPKRCEVLTIGLGGEQTCIVCGDKGPQGHIECLSLDEYRKAILACNTMRDLAAMALGDRR